MTKIKQNLKNKLSNTDEKIQQLQNERKQIMQKFKDAERRERTRRLIERGAIIESFVQGAIEMTNDEFMNHLKEHLGDLQAPVEQTQDEPAQKDGVKEDAAVIEDESDGDENSVF